MEMRTGKTFTLVGGRVKRGISGAVLKKNCYGHFIPGESSDKRIFELLSLVDVQKGYRQAKMVDGSQQEVEMYVFIPKSADITLHEQHYPRSLRRSHGVLIGMKAGDRITVKYVFFGLFPANYDLYYDGEKLEVSKPRSVENNLELMEGLFVRRGLRLETV